MYFLNKRDFFQKHFKIVFQIRTGSVSCSLWYQHDWYLFVVLLSTGRSRTHWRWPRDDPRCQSHRSIPVDQSSVGTSQGVCAKQGGQCVVLWSWSGHYWFRLHQHTQEACSGIIRCWFIQGLHQQQALQCALHPWTGQETGGNQRHMLQSPSRLVVNDSFQYVSIICQ